MVTLIEHLLGKGRDLCVYDPHIGKLMAASLDDMLESCGSLIVTQKTSAETADKIRRSGIRVLNVASS